MLKNGIKAPDFELEDADGNTVSLASLLSDGPLILYFYPADFTPGCTKEACEIRDIHHKIAGAGLQVVGISPQDGATHRRFQDKFALPFRLLCDPRKSVIKAYDVDGPLGIGTRRATYLIDSSGSILDGVLADIRIERHRQFIENAIRLREAA
ncbi:MAG: peroxiredoxin [Proteobacteria bacterium]|nr:peroxiredoxin [Pseudomonadota bacterium]